MIPSSVKFIESYAFNGCSALRDVFYIGDANSWNRMHFGSNNDPIINASVHYNHKHESGIPVKENEVSATETQGGSYDEVVYCAACGAEISRTSKTIVPLGIEQQTESPAGSTTKPQKLNFFQRIIQWFRSLFARLFKR